MSYDTHTWLEGEVITAEKLQHLEKGIGCLANCSAMWINPSPEAAFAAQSISLDTTAFSEFEFYFLIEDNDVWQTISFRFNKNRAYTKNGAWHFPVKYGNYERFVTVEAAQITFTDCKYGINYNDKLIPYSIHAFE